METGRGSRVWPGIALAIGLCALAAVIWWSAETDAPEGDTAPASSDRDTHEPDAALTGSAPDETGTAEPGIVDPGTEAAGADTGQSDEASAPPPLAPEDGVRFAGTVVDPQGRPVPGAVVEARSGRATFFRPELGAYTATADERGMFEVVALSGKSWLVARAEAALSILAVQVDAERGEAFENLRLVVTPTRELRGTVASPRGLPIPGAQITIDGVAGTRGAPVPDVPGAVTTGWQRLVAYSDAQGRFTCGPVSAGHAYSWSAGHSEWLPDAGRVDADGTHLEIRLDAAATLEGRVLDPTGKPVVDARVRVTSTRRPPVKARTDRQGRFEIVGLDPERPALLYAYGKGYALHAEVLDPIGSTGRAEHDVSLEAAHAIRGRVEREDGTPVDRVQVRLVAGRPKLDLGNGHRIAFELAIGASGTLARADGTFTFGHLPSGAYTLIVHDPQARGEVAQVETEAGRDDVRIVLPTPVSKGARLDGRVVDAETGKPIKAYELRVSRRTPKRWALVEVIRAANDSGVFWIEHLPIESLKLDVEAAGYATWTGTLKPAGDAYEDVAIRLLRPRRLTLHVTDAEGTEVDGYGVRFETLDGHALRPSSGSRLLMGSILMLEKGAGLVDGLPATQLRILVDAPIVDGERRTWPFTVDLTKPRNVPLELTLDAP